MEGRQEDREKKSETGGGLGGPAGRLMAEEMKDRYISGTCDPQRFLDDLELYGEQDLLRLMRFGTGGMRGLMRSGFNGVNEVTCNLIGTELAARLPSVVIGCDGRYNSHNYAMLLEQIFKAHGRKAVVYPEVATPFLAFLVHKLGVDGGVMVTASHNPREYNGFKVYTSQGSQIDPSLDREIESSMEALVLTRLGADEEHEEICRRIREENSLLWTKKPFSRGRPCLEKAGGPRRDELIECYNRWMFAGWGDAVVEGIRCTDCAVGIVFTGLCGVSGEFVRKALEFYGLGRAVRFVEEECTPNPDFPGLPFPNPEVGEALDRAKTLGLADIVFSCDPDGDRFGLSERIDGRWVDYNGNEIAAMLMHFFVKSFAPSSLAFVNTHLCNGLMEKVCSVHGIEYHRTETGFKNVSRAVASVRGKHVLAYEDSLGFLFGPGGEKDGIKCVVLMASMVQREPPHMLLRRMERYGRFSSVNIHVRCSDPHGVLERALSRLPDARTEGKRSTVELRDYKVVLRVSGTESMVKVYASSSMLDKEQLTLAAEGFADTYVRKQGLDGDGP